MGDPGTGECGIYAWFEALSRRLERVRVASGDWKRVCDSPTTLFHSAWPTAVFLDPPYSESERDPRCYAVDSAGVAAEVRDWCARMGGDVRLRIALCGYAGEGHEVLEELGWECLAWKAPGGYGNSDNGAGDNTNAYRERIWFSPYCLRPERPRQIVLCFDEDLVDAPAAAAE